MSHLSRSLLILGLLMGWTPKINLHGSIQLTICQIQGSGFSSHYQGIFVETQGIVTADFDQTSQRGFFFQSPNCDQNPLTSDGIFVFLGERGDFVSAGDLVRVKGIVKEYYGMTEIDSSPTDVLIINKSNPLPAPHDLNPPAGNAIAQQYFETMEGMLVSLSDGRVVGPTDSSDRTWLIRSDLGIERVFHDDPQGTGEIICVDDGGLFEIVPEAAVGDQIKAITGVLDYRYGVYCVQLTAPPLALIEDQSQLSLDMGSTYPGIHIATFNLASLFDTRDDPLTDDAVPTPLEYLRNLQKRALTIGEGLENPSIVAVQEVETKNVVEDLLSRPEIGATYQVLHQDGPDKRGLDIALAFRIDLGNLLSYSVRQACTDLVDGLGPDGNGDPLHPQNSLTCDRDNDGIFDGNRLFSRPPLAAHFLVRPNRNSSSAPNFFDIWIIACHFKSRKEDTISASYTLPRRLEQAQFVSDLAQEILIDYPNSTLIILGDLNDYPESQPLKRLTQSSFSSAISLIDHPARFSYIYHGVSQTLDYILYLTQPTLLPDKVQFKHINADYPDSWTGVSNTSRRSSDHDPLLLSLAPVKSINYLPVSFR